MKIVLGVVAFVMFVSVTGLALAIPGHMSHGKPTISNITTTQNP